MPFGPPTVLEEAATTTTAPPSVYVSLEWSTGPHLASVCTALL
jgi:hypothetical protein